MHHSEGLDTTGASDLASPQGHKGIRTNQGSSIAYIMNRETCAPTSSEHAQSTTFRLLVEASLTRGSAAFMTF